MHTKITVAATLMLAIALMLTLLAARAVAADDEPEPRPARVRFQPSQRIWQCNDIRVTETITRPWTLGGGTIVNYDLGGTIWGGSQFTFAIERGDLWFNGRPCAPLR